MQLAASSVHEHGVAAELIDLYKGREGFVSVVSVYCVRGMGNVLSASARAMSEVR